MTQALGNITSANAQMYLVVDQLYPAGVPITNFSADSMMTSDDMGRAPRGARELKLSEPERGCRW